MEDYFDDYNQVVIPDDVYEQIADELILNQKQ